LGFAAGNPRAIHRAGAGAVTARQTLNEVGELVADGLIGEPAHFETDDELENFSLTIEDRGAAQVLARVADGDRGVFQFGKIPERAIISKARRVSRRFMGRVQLIGMIEASAGSP